MARTEGGALGRIVLLVGILAFLHSAYSTYEFFSIRKALGLPQTRVSTDIIVETLISFLFLVIGISLNAVPLKKVTWSSEMRTRTIDQVDARSSFASLDHRGPILFNNAASLLKQQ